MALHEKIRLVRKQVGLSQYELADRVKLLNQSQISKIETGGRTISAEDLILLSNALGLPVQDLLTEVKEGYKIRKINEKNGGVPQNEGPLEGL